MCRQISSAQRRWRGPDVNNASEEHLRRVKDPLSRKKLWPSDGNVRDRPAPSSVLDSQMEMTVSDPTVKVPDPSGGYRNAPVSAPSNPFSPSPLPDAPQGGDVTVVDFSALRDAISKTHDVTARAQTLAGDVNGADQRSGPAPWGDDPALGQAFGSVFAGPRAVLLQAVEGLPGMVQQFADTLDGVAASSRGAQRDALLSIVKPASSTGK
jgi:hypothetical protein